MTESLIIKELGTDDIELCSHHLLLKAPVMPERTSGGVFVPEQWRQAESKAPNVGLVVAIGPEAYLPAEKYKNKIRCSVGNWVIYSLYERQHEIINGYDCYFVSDERILAKIKNVNIMLKHVQMVN